VRLAPDAAIAARRKYLFEGVEPGKEVPAPILRSWERSFALGLNMTSRPGLDLLSQQMLREAQQRNEILVRAARGEMEALCRDASIAVVILTDPHGLVLCRLGEGEFAEKAASVALQPGVV
jgi:transcriptional regulator of acetoin/glycerol metabolism